MYQKPGKCVQVLTILFSGCTVLRYTCWWMLDKELLVLSPLLIKFISLLFIFGPSTTILSMAGLVIWTITPHCFLGGGTTLLWCYWKAIAPMGKKNSGGVWLFVFLCALWVCIYICVWSENGLSFVCVSECVVFLFLASMCIVDLLFQCGYYAFML